MPTSSHLCTLVASSLLTDRKQRFFPKCREIFHFACSAHMANATLALWNSLSFLYLPFFSSSRSKNILSWNKFSAFHLLFLWIVWGKCLLFIILATSQFLGFFLQSIGNPYLNRDAGTPLWVWLPLHLWGHHLQLREQSSVIWSWRTTLLFLWSQLTEF